MPDTEALEFLSQEIHSEHYDDLTSEQAKVIRDELEFRDSLGYRS
jgi:hypothetical protein